MAIAELRHVLSDTKAASCAVSCPALWVSARPTDTAIVTDLFRDVMIGHVVGSGHFVQIEVPDQLKPTMRTFLTRQHPTRG